MRLRAALRALRRLGRVALAAPQLRRRDGRGLPLVALLDDILGACDGRRLGWFRGGARAVQVGKLAFAPLDRFETLREFAPLAASLAPLAPQPAPARLPVV